MSNESNAIDNGMTDAAREAQRAYNRAWEAKNKEKRAAQRRAWWNRKAEQMKAEREPTHEAE